MISRRQVPLFLLARANRPGSLPARSFHRQQQQQQQRQQTTAAPGTAVQGSLGGTEARLSGADANDELLLQLEEEYSTLKVNWFPGHMVKATKVIREKLKQVDMVFEVRDARIPFTSANDDLDKIVGPSKARLIVLNKADLSNQALEQRVLQRFKEQGKTAVYACGRTGTNVNKLLTWARERGARRGEFSTTGAVAMVVGMPNVGKSSLINLLRDKANSRGRGRGEGGGGGEGAKQVARVGAMPGVTRQVSAFRIGSTPPLYLVDTPGVMVPRVNSVAAGLCLALTRAVPDSAVPPDILVGFMLRVVRSRRLHGAKGKKGALARAGKEEASPRSGSSGGATLAARGRDASARRPRPQPRRSKAIEAWLLGLEGGERPTGADALILSCPPLSDGEGKDTDIRKTAADDSDPNREQRQQQPHRYASDDDDDDDSRHFGGDDREEEEEEEDKEGEDERKKREEIEREDDMEALLEAVVRESGAEGKPAPEARRICCRYLLDAFQDGHFGTITLDSVPRVPRSGRDHGNFSEHSSSAEFSAQAGSEASAGWWAPPTSPPPPQQGGSVGSGGDLVHQQYNGEVGVGRGGDGAGSAAAAAQRNGLDDTAVVRTPVIATGARKRRDRRRSKQRQQQQQLPASPDQSDLADRLVRDWSSPDAWERADARGRS